MFIFQNSSYCSFNSEEGDIRNLKEKNGYAKPALE
jgi:hypothetical protein